MPLRMQVVGAPHLFVENVADVLRSRGALDEPPWRVEVGGAFHDVDVIVVLGLGSDPPQEIQQARSAQPDTGVVWVGGKPGHRAISSAVGQGCWAVVSGSSGVDELVQAVRVVAAGERWASPDLVGELMNSQPDPDGHLRDVLSSREMDVLGLLKAGKSTADIAAELFISLHTARNHVRGILRKLGAHSRLEAIAIATQHETTRPA